LDDFFEPFQMFFNTNIGRGKLLTKSQNVLTPYHSGSWVRTSVTNIKLKSMG
jgi:hypothetical protein